MRPFNSTFIPAPPFCIAWNLIPKDKKLALEIGAGNGFFSENFAESHKDWFLISLERTKEKSDSFFKRNKTPLHNLLFLRADAINVVTHLIPKNQLDGIFIPYPNPYPKKRQNNQRWHNMPFFTELLTRLKAEGVIELRTNLRWYAEEFKDQACNTHGLTLSHFEVLGATHIPQTAFEKKYLAQGQECFKLVFKKTSCS